MKKVSFEEFKMYLKANDLEHCGQGISIADPPLIYYEADGNKAEAKIILNRPPEEREYFILES